MEMAKWRLSLFQRPRSLSASRRGLDINYAISGVAMKASARLKIVTQFYLEKPDSTASPSSIRILPFVCCYCERIASLRARGQIPPELCLRASNLTLPSK